MFIDKINLVKQILNLFKISICETGVKGGKSYSGR